MTPIRRGVLPAHALLQQRARAGDYTDCYTADIPRAVTQAAFVEAFYTTALFKIERVILRVAVQRPSTDAGAKALAAGSTTAFAAWNVEQRNADQMLLADFGGRTRSWLMVEPLADGATRLYFGSAVTTRPGRDGRRRMGAGFRALIEFHRLYSRALLHAARRRLGRLQ